MSGDLPIGTPVTYWPGVREGSGVPSFTRSNVWTVCGAPVVLVNGYAGGIALTHIERRLVDQVETARPESEVKAEALREAAEIWHETARSARTRDGAAEAENFADWLDERASLTDPRRLEGAHP